MMKRWTFFLLATLLLLPIPVSASNGQDELCSSGVCFPRQVEVGGQVLEARDVRTFRYWGFRVYTITLYIPPGTEGIDGVLDGETPRRLILHYHRGITAGEFAESSEEFIRRNPRNDMNALRERLDQLYDAYRDVESGDRYSITYIPNSGTTVSLNDEDIIAVEGEDFARAFFGVWLSEEPISTGIRDRLIGS